MNRNESAIRLTLHNRLRIVQLPEDTTPMMYAVISGDLNMVPLKKLFRINFIHI